MKHKVKATSWIDGSIERGEWLFESLEEALTFSESLFGKPFKDTKIYDALDQLVKIVNEKIVESYA